MLHRTTLALILTLCASIPAMAQNSIRITSPEGSVMAGLNDTPTAQALLAMLPLDLPMTDHLRQEKTGDLPQALPAGDRQRDFSVGTLGLWSSGDFVIYYAAGRVPAPGIVILGQVLDDVSIFDNADPVTVRIEAVD
ncbi:cyclophilin-like fold protein [Paracoccus nototheniae]|uniref:Cyclophilin-like fold protein n=1 Tax=Paracoccus nototheniae TaxID=2489002 RepID=A0ABW4DW82_9RHOB|nr:cyclophilin-like fold protein [Paracoccus nototheniae]